MSARLEHEEFARHLHTKFRIRLNETESIDAELSDVSEHLVSPRQERFAVIFRTSNEVFLDQGQRQLQHDQMGEFILFLVPIGRDEEGTYYEACFNRLVKKS
ncbi:MAG TPA: hypothetical protein VKD91_14825 [Pyrinomonadaceae bacterium]|nr:hypothetical protein [Pyrinomonadaceae bacterium]